MSDTCVSSNSRLTHDFSLPMLCRFQLLIIIFYNYIIMYSIIYIYNPKLFYIPSAGQNSSISFSLKKVYSLNKKEGYVLEIHKIAFTNEMSADNIYFARQFGRRNLIHVKIMETRYLREILKKRSVFVTFYFLFRHFVIV